MSIVASLPATARRRSVAVLMLLIAGGAWPAEGDPIAVPVGYELRFEGRVTTGVQTYRCTPEHAYQLVGPTALLTGRDGRLAVHYSGPAWQFQDGSAITGKAIAHDPRKDAVDQLLIEVVRHEGPPGLFSAVDFVQRVATSHGIAPPSCDPQKDATLSVPYEATYRFWSKTRTDPHP